MVLRFFGFLSHSYVLHKIEATNNRFCYFRLVCIEMFLNDGVRILYFKFDINLQMVFSPILKEGALS